MPKKQLLGRRHRNGTGNNKHLAAKREIRPAHVGCAKKAKKKPEKEPSFDLDKEEAAREAQIDREIDELFKPLENYLQWCDEADDDEAEAFADSLKQNPHPAGVSALPKHAAVHPPTHNISV